MKTATEPKIASEVTNIKESHKSDGMHRPSINISPVERWGRIAIGTGVVIVGLILLVSTTSVFAGILEALLVATGLDLFITGARGHCPLYQRLSHVPASFRRPL